MGVAEGRESQGPTREWKREDGRLKEAQNRGQVGTGQEKVTNDSKGSNQMPRKPWHL